MIFSLVSTFAGIDKTSNIKIFDNVGTHVPIKHLKSVIQKYEKKLSFSLDIKLMDENDQALEGHVAKYVQVSTQLSSSITLI